MKFGGVGFICVNQSLLSYVFSECMKVSWSTVKTLYNLKGNHNVVVWLLLLSSWEHKSTIIYNRHFPFTSVHIFDLGEICIVEGLLFQIIVLGKPYWY
jgi:hypothetical protein